MPVSDWLLKKIYCFSKMNNILQLVVFALVIAGFESVAMTYITQYSKTFNVLHIVIGCLIYGLLIPFFLVKGLAFSGIGTANLMWNIVSTVVMIMIGYYLFGEKVNHLHLLSLMFGIGAIVLLYFAEKN